MPDKPMTIHKPIRRQYAEMYLLIMLLSFAASVSLTRLFLELTGYPQLGGGELHIAHVLWGGLILYASALLPLLLANRWVYYISALGAGIGVGLFIDEVGKFITKTNDYFHPSAAPIVYAFFLLSVLIYILVRKKPSFDVRREFYSVLEDMEEVLDHDLSADEQARIKQRLERIIADEKYPELKRLAQTLKRFISGDTSYLVLQTPTFIQRLRGSLLKFEQRWLKQTSFRLVLVIGLALTGLWSMRPVATLINLFKQGRDELLIYNLVNNQLVRSPRSLNWYEINLGFGSVIGTLLILAAVLLLIKKDRIAVMLGYATLLLAMTVANLLLFYFDQFSSIITALVQFVLFLGILRYRFRFVDVKPSQDLSRVEEPG
jgi:hypothetical protein